LMGPGAHRIITLSDTMDTTLYLIRHAQSRPRESQHHSQWVLSERGRHQAERLTPLLEPLGIRRLYSSPFTRCLETIGPFAAASGLDVHVVDDLRERLVVKTWVEDFEEVWSRSWTDFEYALPGCEPSMPAQDRFARAVVTIVEECADGPIAISSHGNVIALFLNWIDGAAGREEADALTNPDVLRISRRDDAFIWDREFRLPGLEEIASDYRETPVVRDGSVDS